MSDDLVRRLRECADRKPPTIALLMIEAADALERRWIPVGEGLPEPGRSYLVMYNGIAQVASRGRYAGLGVDAWSLGEQWPVNIEDYEVTHWMPLSPPPAKRD